MLVALGQGQDGGVLGDGRRAHDRILVDLAHGRQQVFGRGSPAQPPAGHGVRLAHPAQDDGALLHPRQGGEVDMLHAVDQPVVDLVGDDQQVMPGGDGRDLLQPGAGHHRAGRVVGVADQDGPGAGGDGRFHYRPGDLKILLDAGGNHHRRPPG